MFDAHQLARFGIVHRHALPHNILAHRAGNSMMAAPKSHVTAAAMASGGRFTHGQGVAVGGQRTDQIAAQLATLSAAIPANCVIVQEGTNDAAQGVSVASHVANMRTVLRDIAARGFLPILIATPPSDAAYAASVNQMSVADRILAAQEGAVFVDPWRRYTDTDGTWTAGASADAVHPTSAVYDQVGRDMWSMLSGSLADSLQPRGNAGQGLFASNALLLTDSNADGLPDNWSALALTAPVFGLGAGAFPVAGNVCTVTVAQATAGYVYRQVANPGNGRLVCIAGWLGLANPVNVTASIFLRFNGAGMDAVVATATNARTLAPFCALAVIPGGTNNLQVYVEVTSAAGGAFSGDVQFAGIDVYDLSALGF